MAVADQPSATAAPAPRPPLKLLKNLNAKIASIPMVMTAMVIFVGCSAWTILHSFTSSKLLPKLDFVGLDQYERLWGTNRWIISIENLAIYGFCSMILSLTIGFLLAALLDRKIRFESAFRTIFPLPFCAVVHRYRPCLAMDSEPRVRRPEYRAANGLGKLSHSIRSTTPIS